MNERICPACGHSRPSESFVSTTGTRKYKQCQSCRNERSRRSMRKRLVYNYALLRGMIVAHMGGKCVRCGYEEFGEALQFHNTGSSRSKMAMLINRFCYGGTERAWENLNNELRQCVLLCSNCQYVDRLGLIMVKGHADCGDMPFPASNE